MQYERRLPTDTLAEKAGAVRRFNRFYTQRIGVLGGNLLRSRFSLSEARVLYELASRQGHVTAGDMANDLRIDPGYMSRIVGRFEDAGLLQRSRSTVDRRRRVLRLTEHGQGAFAELDTRSQREFEVMLSNMTDADQRRLLAAMRTIESLLGNVPVAAPSFVLRPHQPGDIGWVIHRHGVLYALEHGWDATFETLVARILADFLERYDPQRDCSWIAEMDGEPVGSVFVVRQSDRIAQLRLLLVEPKARGHGLGRRLVDECIRFAGRAGYDRLQLWTNDVLHAARHIYEQAGFRLVKEEPHNSFGHDLVGQTWEVDVRQRLS